MITMGKNNNNQIVDKIVNMELVDIDHELFYKIVDHDKMRPFFMSIVSDSNHWMFISSNGGMTAGRKNAEFALFPYYTDDKITESADITGSKTIFQIKKDGETILWEPFSDRFNDSYQISRNLYKNIYGNKVIFEEIFHDLGLEFSYEWSSSNRYGFVRTSTLINTSDEDLDINVLDGIQNVVPFGVGSDLQNSTSNLVDAYKRNELVSASGLGIYALSAIIVDKAEPSEALKCNIAWSIGMKNPTYLVSSKQLNAFRNQQPIVQETDVKGEKGAFFLVSSIRLNRWRAERWKIIANVNQNHAQVIALSHDIIHNKAIENDIIDDVDLGTKNLKALNATADGFQYTADKRKDTRHFANVLFNIMRGGVFDENYQIDKKDFVAYLERANKVVTERHQNFILNLSDTFSYIDLKMSLKHIEDADLVRLCTEYLPLKFSRRHGDPSRPWNKFSINTRSEIDGSKILDYQGNWRDIFQNWEALAYAYPDFIEGMIHKFLNATTFDGYNPYRVTKDGFDWETIEHDNPWSYIGYWGDHQIIYLLKFLEFMEKYQPGKLNDYFDNECFVYAAVPYIIKPYSEIVQNPKDTISYNFEWEEKINKRKTEIGADGALLRDNTNEIYHVNLIEKILATVLAKMSNFIPEAGIWMNTQRPEWNDANNALVGNGVSMVTLYYLRRFLLFFQGIIEKSDLETIKISNEMVEFYHAIRENLLQHAALLDGPIHDKQRKEIMDILGNAASEYRHQVYFSGFWGKKRTHSMSGLKTFTKVCLDFIEHTIKTNERKDKLFHAYNLISIKNDEVTIDYLPEMLEGQVAVLSSGYVKGKQALDVLDALRNSTLYRPDQNSYILYPNKNLPKFLEKNTISKEKVAAFGLLNLLKENNNQTIVNQDINGDYHFNGNFNNARDLKNALEVLKGNPDYKKLVDKEENGILDLFEEVFNHKAFTGRSGTFYAFEGLGSIYWHMVSKLHLAVYEICEKAFEDKEDATTIDRLVQHFREIGDGIGVHKSPEVYGAFPTDPYSHTPLHRGAQQPGMTGQVKEDVLTRIGELGVKIAAGKLAFKPEIMQKSEFSAKSQDVAFILADGTEKIIHLEANSLAFSVCQVPVVYRIGDSTHMEIHFKDQSVVHSERFTLSEENSQLIFQRTGDIVYIELTLPQSILR
jgi:hypothetical protein